MTGVTVAITDKLKGVAQTLEMSLPWNMTQMVDNLFDIAICEFWIAIVQINRQIVDIWVFDKQWLAQRAVDVSTIGILPALGL